MKKRAKPLNENLQDSVQEKDRIPGFPRSFITFDLPADVEKDLRDSEGRRLSHETVWDVVKVIDLEIEATKKEMSEIFQSEDLTSMIPEGEHMFIWIRGRSPGKVRLAYLSNKLEVLKDIRDKITMRFIG